VSAALEYRELGEAAWAWVLGQVRGHDGPWLPDEVDDDPPQPTGDRDTFYAGIAGLAPVLAELARHRELDSTERALAAGIVDRLARLAPAGLEPSLYDGLAGYVAALRLLAPGRETVALDRLAELSTPAGWATTMDVDPGSRAPLTDVVMGSAGVVMAAAWTGGEAATAIMTTGGEALLRVAEPTDGGLDWRMFPGYRSSSPNFSHGTAGVGSALAVAGHALGRSDFVAAARQGAEHLLRVGSLDDGGFIVEHTFPRSHREVEPVTYNWCHGPAGTSQFFAALARAGVEEVGGYDVGELRRRCLHSVLSSGVPQRLRSGFWDNDGRCCGTAGVGDVVLNVWQRHGLDDDLAFAVTLGDALVERAIDDGDHAYWRFVEHRNEDPLLPPSPGWMQGAAGIAAYLFRLARLLDQGRDAAAVARMDSWWALADA